MNRKELAAKAFDEIKQIQFEREKAEFIEKATRFYNGEETEESLAKKAQIVADLMTEGVEFHTACDDKRVYLGQQDSSFIYDKYILKSFSGTYEEWVLRYFKRQVN